jgi:glutathione S-transferase
MTKQPQLELCELADTGIPSLESWSPFCLKVHRALKLARLTYRRRHGRSPGDFRHLNRAAQVPVLLIDGEPIADSTAILARIDLLAPGAFAHSKDPRLEAEIDLYEELADTSLNAYLVAARWADDRNWPAVERAYFEGMPALLRRLIVPRLRKSVVQRAIAREVWRRGPDACWAQLVSLLDRLEDRAPKEGFWSTERPSIADVALFAQLHSLRAPLTPWQAARIAERTTLSAYLDRVGAATIGVPDGMQYGSSSAHDDVAWSAHG